MFVVPFMIVISRILEGTSLFVCLLISFIGQLGMYSFELMAIKVEGFKGYFADKWNYIDQLNIVLYSIFCGLIISFGEKEFINTDSDSLKNCFKLLTSVIVVLTWGKLTWLQKQFESFGLL